MTSEEIIRIGGIICKKLVRQEDLTQSEESLLNRWLDESEQNREFYRNFSPEKKYAEYLDVISLSSQKRQWSRMEGLLNAKARHRVRKKWIGYAAGIALILGSGITLVWNSINKVGPKIAGTEYEYIEPISNKAILILSDGNTVSIDGTEQVIEDGVSYIRISDSQLLYEHPEESHNAETVYNTIRVPRKGVFAIELSDGTNIFLNPGSELRYPVAFIGPTREVTLSGEARFDVTHDPRKPFIVNAGDNTITVLGTSFIISAYHDEPFRTASLLDGSIEISNPDGSVKRVLIPGKQAVWKEGGQSITVEDFNPEHLRLFREGTVTLVEKDLQSIMRMLGRWFDIDVDYALSTTADYSITLKFQRQDDLHEILEKITRIGGPKFRIENSTIYVN